ncbi:MAG: TonB-dependent receptor plug domain-containing protein [Gemmatimonadales bacterium]
MVLKKSLIQAVSPPGHGIADPPRNLGSPQPSKVTKAGPTSRKTRPPHAPAADHSAGWRASAASAPASGSANRHQGLTSNRVLVLDNGQRLETQQWGDEHAPNVETATAERIEVIKGPASVLYGSDALGGVVNVIPRALPWSDGAPVTRGTISASYGTNNRQPDGSLLVEGGGRTLAARLALSGRTSGDLRTPDYTLWNSSNRAVGGTGTVGIRGGWGEVTGTFSQRNERIADRRGGSARRRPSGSKPAGGGSTSTPRSAAGGWSRSRLRTEPAPQFESAATDEVGLGLSVGSWTGNLHLHRAPARPPERYPWLLG